MIKDNEFVKVETKLKEIKSIENIDIYFNDKNELGIKFTDRTPIAYLKDSNSLIDINGNIFKKEQTKNYSLPSINGNISEQQILKILNVISAIKKDKFFENKLKEIWFKNDHLYVRIKNLELDVNLGNQNKINDKLKMLKGFYIYKSKKINHKNYKQIDLVYNNRLVAIKNNIMNKSFSVGLDIGTTKIVAMVGEKNQFNKINVLGVGKSQSLGVPSRCCE